MSKFKCCITYQHIQCRHTRCTNSIALSPTNTTNMHTQPQCTNANALSPINTTNTHEHCKHSTISKPQMKKVNVGGGNSESLKNSHSHKSSPVRNFTDAHRKLRRKLKIDSKEFESRENLAGKWCVVSPIWGIWVEFEWLCSMRRKTLTLILSNFYHNFVFLPSFHLRCPLSSPAFQIAPLPGCISSYFSLLNLNAGI